MRFTSRQASNQRRGVVLLVVMVMLALFSTVALSFVFYADSEAVTANLNQQSIVPQQPEIDPEVLGAYFLGQLIYDTDNVYSAMRGWSMARSIYGYNPDALNYTPYNGVGRTSLSYPVSFGASTVDNFELINYQRFDGTDPTDPYLKIDRKPEFYGKSGDPNYRYVGGANPPWTSYDTNSLFLAEVGAYGGPDAIIKTQSFYRPRNSANPFADPSAKGRYMTLRPHQSWNPSFSTPDSDGGGDVKNRVYGPGVPDPNNPGKFFNNDSFWMDLGYPVMTAPNGTRYKPLFAAHVVDLNNRLHLWAHGNRIGKNGAHVSNEGHGPPEVNLGYLPGADAVEMQLLFDLKYGGPAGTGQPQGSSINFRAGNWYSLADADGLDPSSQISTYPRFFHASTNSSNAVGTGNQSMTVNSLIATAANGFPVTLLTGMQVHITDPTPANSETVQVLSVNTAGNSFTASFVSAHPAGVAVGFGGSSYFPFPKYAPGWNNTVGEIVNSPLGLNLLSPTSPNARVMPASHMEAYLRYGDTNAPALTSEIFRRMPKTFSDPRSRNMVTLASWYLDRIAAAPFLNFDRTTPGHYQYQFQLAGAPKYPRFSPASMTPPDYSNAGSIVTTNSDFGADARSVLGTQLRVNMNRPLADYPTLVGGIIDTSNSATVVAFNLAQTQRQQFARDIYNALIRITGAQDPNPPFPAANVNPASTDYQAARWLAQLAVNIVDYIDNDDYITPFTWFGTDIVYGTELPRLVLNEAYAQTDNDPNDPMIMNPVNNMPKAATSKLNLWVELHNPFTGTLPTSTYPLDGGAANLLINNNPVYQVVVYPSSPQLTANLRNPTNPEINLGNPDKTQFPALLTASDWGNTAVEQQVLPANGAFKDATSTNRGFYVLGSNQANFVPGRNPQIKTTHASASMSYKNPNVNPPANYLVTFLLQRLLVPHLPPQPNAGQALYNPYITVDYFDGVTVYDNRAFDANGAINNPGLGTYQSFGRKQPYTAYASANATSQVVAQVNNGNAAAGQPQHTFYSHNSTLSAPFDWLVHLDRPPVNAIELRHVSCYKPHELTQQFVAPDVTGAVKKFQHRAPWSDSTTLLYRALDLLGTPSHLAGTYPGGRVPGNINLNTITEAEVFQALCDSQESIQLNPLFTKARVQQIFTNLILSRNLPVNNAHPEEGNPFLPLSADDVKKTWLRPDPTSMTTPPAPLFTIGASGNHNYLRTSLLQKIHNNITTTSNVFAVWWTVGFFEVVDESVRPPRLGKEVGRDQNRHIRHRFFSIVDRSNLQIYATASTSAVSVTAATVQPLTVNFDLNNVTTSTGAITVYSPTQSYVRGNVVSSGGAAYLCTNANTNIPTTNTANWQPLVQPGMLLRIDSGSNNTEVVAVQSVAGNTITANFTKSHAAGVPIVCRGNPGPQTNYNPYHDTGVVLHLSVIR